MYLGVVLRRSTRTNFIQLEPFGKCLIVRLHGHLRELLRMLKGGYISDVTQTNVTLISRADSVVND